MRGKWVLIILGILVVFAIVSIAGNAKTIYVGPSEKYTSIQSAIDNATDGDRIIVRDGIYYEHVKVTKERLTIKSENGSDNCIIDGEGKGIVITLKADRITIEGFTIRNSTIGIKVFSDSNNIRYNNILNNRDSIYLQGSSNNDILHNNISNIWYPEDGYGILLEESSNNNIAYNRIFEKGIGLRIATLSNKNRITHNNISNNWGPAISVIEYSCFNCIEKNNFINNDRDNSIIDNHSVQAFFVLSFQNHWLRNYWDDWRIILPRPIFGLGMFIPIPSDSSEPPIALPIPWVNFDWFPAMRPYSID